MPADWKTMVNVHAMLTAYKDLKILATVRVKNKTNETEHFYCSDAAQMIVSDPEMSKNKVSDSHIKNSSNFGEKLFLVEF